jgi:hypothetical protein
MGVLTNKPVFDSKSSVSRPIAIGLVKKKMDFSGKHIWGIPEYKL